MVVAASATAEQPRIEVKKLTITGVKSVPVGELKRALATSASPWIPWGAQHDFNRAQFEADLKRIEVFCGDRGFPDGAAHEALQAAKPNAEARAGD